MPPDDPVCRQRLGQSCTSLDVLAREIRLWIERRRKKDTHGQYTTQLTALGERFELMLGELDRSFGAIPADAERRDYYVTCRDLDERIIWVRRLYQWYRTKFDQRDDPALARTLAAADEVVWSCFAQPFRTVDAPPPAVPLPFFEPVYAPSAIPRVEPPQDLRSDINGEFLGKMLNELPVPVVSLPWLCVEEPWWLAFVAHEVGHHVQADFLNTRGQQQGFVDAIRGAGGDRWAGWHEELFADLYSVLMIGEWAPWALTELVWDNDAAMLDSTRPRYPASLLRLLFMKAVANELKAPHDVALRGIDAKVLTPKAPVMFRGEDIREVARLDAAKAAAVAKAALGAADTTGLSLANLTAFVADEFAAPDGDIPLWSRALRGDGSMSIEQELRSARVVLAAAVHAWAGLTETADDDVRETQRVALRDQTIATILASREEVVREAAPTATATADPGGERLLDLLMREAPRV